MHCIAEPAYDFFGEETGFDPLVVDNNVIPLVDPGLSKRKLYSDTPATILDINDWFDRHRRQSACYRNPRNPRSIHVGW